MSYRVKRIDIFWHNHPMIPTGVAIGTLLGVMGFVTNKPVLQIAGGAVAAIAILAAARPLISAVLATLGVLGGLVTFVLVPNLQAAGMSLGLKLLSSLLFALFYMVLMDALVLVLAVLYNLFGSVMGMPGISLELEGEGQAGSEDEAA